VRIGVDARELQGRPTGVGRYLRGLLRNWPPDAGDELILYFNGPAPHDPVLANARIALRPLGSQPTRGLRWQEGRLPAAVRRDRLDVFFAPAYACPLSLSVPRVTTIHDLSFFSQPEDFTPLDGLRRRILVGLSLGASRRILTDSDFTRREIVGRRPDADGRVDVIPLGADDDLPTGPPRAEARERLGIAGSFLVSVGSILNRRRLPALLQGMALVARSHPSVLLDVVGENRTHPRLDLSRIVERLRLKERVRFSGFVSDEDLALRYAAADGAVYLSEYEGFGLPVLEAMARGLPVVTSLRPATGEIFGEAALTVDPSDTEGIAGAIDRLLHDTDLRSRLTASGRSLAARHTWATAAARTRSALATAAR